MSYQRNLARIARKGVITVATAQELRDLTIYGGDYPESVETLGTLAMGDGGNGLWRWDETSTSADNTGYFLLPTGHTGAGRWRRVDTTDQVIRTAYFFGKGNHTTDQSSKLQLILDDLQPGYTLVFDSDLLIESAVIVFTDNIALLGHENYSIMRKSSAQDNLLFIYTDSSVIDGLNLVTDIANKTVTKAINGVLTNTLIKNCRIDGFVNGIAITTPYFWNGAGFPVPPAYKIVTREPGNNVFAHNHLVNMRGDGNVTISKGNGCGIRSYGTGERFIGNTVLGDPSYITGDLLHGLKAEITTLYARASNDPNRKMNHDEMHFGSGAVFDSNFVKGAFTHGIYSEEGAGAIISNNVVIGTFRDGIKLTSNNSLVSDNVVQGGSSSNESTGINCFTGSNITLSGNVIFPADGANVETTKFGIDIGAFAGNVVIRDNLLSIGSLRSSYYGLSNLSGTFSDSQRIEASGGHKAQSGSLYGSDLYARVHSGPWEVGETLTQTGGWSATVARVPASRGLFGRGIRINNSKECTIGGNNILNGCCVTDAITVTESDSVTVFGNKIEGRGKIPKGVRVISNSTNVDVVENYIDGVSGVGIEVSVNGAHVARNVVRGTAGTGILFFNASDVIYTGNFTANTLTKPYSLGGTSTLLLANGNSHPKDFVPGQATIPNGSDRVVVPHDFGAKPSSVIVTYSGGTAGTSVLRAPSALFSTTTFTIVADVTATGDVPVAWVAYR